ncbi:MAG: flagellar basal-body rod protein FlgG [Planctomycetota bacterium]|jgi:flagellar basal-body rod protein FlgG|nr:flagellar basal-body rod protein FlgG [Planctomycetota bacterium]
MLRAFSTAATGMNAQQMIVDTIANNLANLNTVGFKRSQVDFQDLMYLQLAEAGREIASGVIAPSGLELGCGVRPASTLKVFTQGEADNTERTLDLMIEGDGFFQVTLPNGETRYTRDGSLRLNANGSLVTASGHPLSPAITVPTDARSISIGQDGTVTVFAGAATTASNVGQVQLVRFANSSGLRAEGENLLAETPASGQAVVGTAGQDGLGNLRQGFLERSNVQMVRELVNLITAQRAYEINSRAIRAGDEMLTTANQLIR